MDGEAVAKIGVGKEPQSRAGMGLNCAARLGAELERECKRKARKGDYCVQHWQMNFGHDFDFNVVGHPCKCGVKWADAHDEICASKITLVEF